MNRQQKAYLYAGISIFFWSTVPTVFKIGLGILSFTRFLFIATLVSTVIFLLLILIQKKLALLRACTARQFLISALLGLLNPFLYYLVLFRAYILLPAQVAQPLNMIWPILLVFLSVPLLRQKIPGKSYLALFISFIGVYLISSQGNILSLNIKEPFGVVLALGSAIMWAFFWLLNVRDKRDETVKLGLSFFFASLYMILLIVLSPGDGPWPLKGIALAAYAGMFEMGITFFFWIKALQMTRSTDKISNLVYIAPFLSLFIIHIFVKERIYITTVAGLVFIVAGILLEKLSLRKYPL
jgi:drug/metabolite transporter (DMT)-like permease